MNRIPFETDKFFTGNQDTGLPDVGVWKIRSTHCAIDISYSFGVASVSLVDSVSVDGEEGFYFHLDTRFFKEGSCIFNDARDWVVSSGSRLSSVGCDMWKCAGTGYDVADICNDRGYPCEVVPFGPTAEKKSRMISSFLRALSLRKVFAKDNPTLKAQFDASVIEENPATGLKSLLIHMGAPGSLEYGNTGVLSAMMAVNCAYRWETRAGVGR